MAFLKNDFSSKLSMTKALHNDSIVAHLKGQNDGETPAGKNQLNFKDLSD